MFENIIKFCRYEKNAPLFRCKNLCTPLSFGHTFCYFRSLPSKILTSMWSLYIHLSGSRILPYLTKTKIVVSSCPRPNVCEYVFRIMKKKYSLLHSCPYLFSAYQITFPTISTVSMLFYSCGQIRYDDG